MNKMPVIMPPAITEEKIYLVLTSRVPVDYQQEKSKNNEVG